MRLSAPSTSKARRGTRFSGSSPLKKGKCIDRRNGDKHVLVVGGGIGGITAALDLASCGVRVTMVEAGPSIGGRMIQLDKTFPTLDCSTCTLSPKMVEVALQKEHRPSVVDAARLDKEIGRRLRRSRF